MTPNLSISLFICSSSDDNLFAKCSSIPAEDQLDLALESGDARHDTLCRSLFDLLSVQTLLLARLPDGKI